MQTGRFLIHNFTAQDGYVVKTPDEIRVVEVTPGGWVRVIWDVETRDQSWERGEAIEPTVLERLIDGTSQQFLGIPDPRFPSLTTPQPAPHPFGPRF